jgi:hypothetical protein
MNIRRVLIGILCAVLLPWVGFNPKALAITACDVVVTPNIPGAQAEYIFYFSIEKKVEVYDWICLQFPKDIIFPELEEFDDSIEMRFDHYNKTITFLSHIALDPSIEGYRDIRITLPRSLGIKNPPTSGAYYFGISTKTERKMKKSNEVVISRNPTSILECDISVGSSVVHIKEVSKPYKRKYAIHPPLLKKNLNLLSASYVPVQHFGTYFDMTFFQNLSPVTNEIVYTWINRSKQRLEFRMNSEGVSPPFVDGIEQKWMNPPFIFSQTSKVLYVDIHSMMKLFAYTLHDYEQTEYFSYRDPFGLEYLFNRNNLILEVSRISPQYVYDYHLLSPAQAIDGDLHIDLNFFIFHLWSMMEITETKIKSSDGEETELVYSGKDENNNLWKVNFTYLSTNNQLTLTHVKIYLNNHEIDVPKLILPCREVIGPKIDQTQVLVSLKTIITFMGAQYTTRRTSPEVSVTFFSKNYSPLLSKESSKTTGEWELEFIVNSFETNQKNILNINELLKKEDVKGVVLHF